MKRLSVMTIVLLVLTALSCRDAGGPTSSSTGGPSIGPAGDLVLTFSEAPADVVQILASLTRAGFALRTAVLTTTDSMSRATGTFANVEAGTWHLKVEAKGNGGMVLYSGETDVDVLPGQTSQVSLQLTPATGSIDITVTWGGHCSPPPSGLVSWWPGDGSTRDIIGSHDGIPVPSVTYVPGEVGRAFSFDGVSQFVRVPNTVALNPAGSFSIDAWIFPTRDVLEATIFGKWGGASGEWAAQASWWVGIGTGQTVDFSMSDSAHQHDVTYHIFRSAPGSVKLNTWSHVAAVFDRSSFTRRIYVNGKLIAQFQYPPFNNFMSIADAGIGGWPMTSTSSNYFFPGMIDEVDFYNRALTGPEIQAIVAAGNTGKCR